jgi:hypothetical protein
MAQSAQVATSIRLGFITSFSHLHVIDVGRQDTPREIGVVEVGWAKKVAAVSRSHVFLLAYPLTAVDVRQPESPIRPQPG